MVNAIFPTVVEQCRVKNLPTRQKTLVDILIDFVKASRDVYGSVSVTAMEGMLLWDDNARSFSKVISPL